MCIIYQSVCESCRELHIALTKLYGCMGVLTSLVSKMKCEYFEVPLSNMFTIDIFWHCANFSKKTNSDVDALSRYVVALVRKNKSVEELNRLCVERLDCFFDGSKMFSCPHKKQPL